MVQEYSGSLGTLIDETVRMYVSGNLQEWPIAPRGRPCHVDDLRVSIQDTIEGQSKKQKKDEGGPSGQYGRLYKIPT